MWLAVWGCDEEGHLDTPWVVVGRWMRGINGVVVCDITAYRHTALFFGRLGLVVVHSTGVRGQRKVGGILIITLAVRDSASYFPSSGIWGVLVFFVASI